MAWVFEGQYHLPAWLKRIEDRVDTGPQNWKQYALAFMLFNLVTLRRRVRGLDVYSLIFP